MTKAELRKACVQVHDLGDMAYLVDLPLLLPSGDHLGIQVIDFGDGTYSLSDNMYAYREVDSMGGRYSFHRYAKKAAEKFGVTYGHQSFNYYTKADDEIGASIACLANAAKYAVDLYCIKTEKKRKKA